ncbi:MAG: hypothetical protein ACREID_06100 [Planctomycetota bacterium]
MRRAAVAAAAFLLGVQLARGEGDVARVAGELAERQEVLFKDVEKIAKAAKDIVEVRETRESGRFVLNDEEIALEKKAQADLHIFMERYRNDTLETLAIYDALAGKRAVDPLRELFGKALDEIVEVEWEDRGIDEIADELSAGYGVKMFVKGDVDQRLSLSLNGKMSLRAVLAHIANVFHVKLARDGDELWFVRSDEAAATPDGEADPGGAGD